MKQIVPNHELAPLFYRYNFRLYLDEYLTEQSSVEHWLRDNVKGPHGLIEVQFWHGEDSGESGGKVVIVTIEENYEAILFKTTWV